jgi:transcriptional regulator with GAF, ATPase, and Fis domain
MKSPRCRPPLQAKLLRVTQERAFQRVGSNTEVQTNARILAATNRILEDEVKAGRFREDLFYRLNVVEFNVRRCASGARTFCRWPAAFIAEFTKGKARFSDRSPPVWNAIPWPGNVRELRNAMERAALLIPQRTHPAGASARHACAPPRDLPAPRQPKPATGRAVGGN